MESLKHLMLTALVASVNVLSAYAHDFEVPNSDGVTIYYQKLTENTCAVTHKGTDYYDVNTYTVESLVIPSSVIYDGAAYSVTEIGPYAFNGCSSLTSIYIPNSVTAIGNLAFVDCSSLTTINIPNSVMAIGPSTFAGCTSLPVENGVRYADTYAVEAIRQDVNAVCLKEGTRFIGYHAFRNCSNLTSIELPNSAMFIAGDDLFAGCSSLTSINIPNSWTYIAQSMFFGCSSLTSIILPSSVTYIENEAFSGCSSLTLINIPESVTSISSDAFKGCESLPVENGVRYADTYAVEAVDKTQTTYVLKEGTRFIGAGAFSDCLNLISMELPNSIALITSNMFQGCSSLTSIRIPNSVTSIGSRAFYGCSSLTSVEIPSSMTSIGILAFNGCDALNAVYSARVNPPTVDRSRPPFSSKILRNATLYVPESAVDTYSTTRMWKEFKEILPYDFSAAIEEINAEESFSGVYNVYDLSGKSVLSAKNAAEFQTLAPGVYIVNGRKVMVR